MTIVKIIKCRYYVFNFAFRQGVTRGHDLRYTDREIDRQTDRQKLTIFWLQANRADLPKIQEANLE